MTVTCHAIAVSFVIPKSRGTGFVRALPAVPPAFTFVGAGLRPAPLRMPRTALSIDAEVAISAHDAGKC